MINCIYKANIKRPLTAKNLSKKRSEAHKTIPVISDFEKTIILLITGELEQGFVDLQFWPIMS